MPQPSGRLHSLAAALRKLPTSAKGRDLRCVLLSKPQLTMMIRRTLLSAIFTAVAALSAYADSGGPYIGVPDAKASERGPIFQIPPSDKPLRHYLTHMAKLEWDMRINEPTTFSWVPIAGCHASMSSLGHLGGHEILCIRYVSDKRLDQGLDQAETILLLARQQDGTPAPVLCTPIFFSNGGPEIYNWVAQALPSGGEGPTGIKITGHISGTGGFQNVTHLQYRNGKFIRLEPDAAKSQE